MKKDSFGDRMKAYEKANEVIHDIALPLIVRLDGRGFSRYTAKKKFTRPVDGDMSSAMYDTTIFLMEETGAHASYTQSDEITLVFEAIDPETNQQRIFGSKTTKINSVFASMATAKFISLMGAEFLPHFDCRSFTVPSEVEAANAVLWRIKDFERNIVSMVARSLFSHKELQGKSCKEMEKMISDAGEDYLLENSRGSNFLFYRKMTTFYPDSIDVPEKYKSNNPVTRNAIYVESYPQSIKNLRGVIFNQEDIEYAD